MSLILYPCCYCFLRSNFVLLRVQPLVNVRAVQITSIAAAQNCYPPVLGNSWRTCRWTGPARQGCPAPRRPQGTAPWLRAPAPTTRGPGAFANPYANMRNSVASKPIHYPCRSFPEDCRTQSERQVDHRSSDSALEEVQITRGALQNTPPGR